MQCSEIQGWTGTWAKQREALYQSRSLFLSCEDEDPASWKDGWWCARQIHEQHHQGSPEHLLKNSGTKWNLHLHLTDNSKEQFPSCGRSSHGVDVCEAASGDVSEPDASHSLSGLREDLERYTGAARGLDIRVGEGLRWIGMKWASNVFRMFLMEHEWRSQLGAGGSCRSLIQLASQCFSLLGAFSERVCRKMSGMSLLTNRIKNCRLSATEHRSSSWAMDSLSSSFTSSRTFCLLSSPLRSTWWSPLLLPEVSAYKVSLGITLSEDQYRQDWGIAIPSAPK